jgi:hypothetical protein
MGLSTGLYSPQLTGRGIFAEDNEAETNSGERLRHRLLFGVWVE